MFDPGNLAELQGCDSRVGASAALYLWLTQNPNHKLVLLAGALTAEGAHAGIHDPGHDAQGRRHISHLAGRGRAGYATSRRVVRTTPAASGTATQKRTETEICGT